MMSSPSTVTSEHLRRLAYLYVRQSSLQQVQDHRESTARQYDLKRRAQALGWSTEQIVVVDEDLGLSGASAGERSGFQRLVAEVGLGRVGLVMGLEVSRLARNSSDWHRLLEICALAETLILDEDGIYDPSHFNDRLLLGLKGTMSEAELHVLRARLLGGSLNKARRGELWMRPPIGLVIDRTGRLTLDPDAQIQSAVRLLFETFRRTGSALQVVRHFAREGILWPRRLYTGGRAGEVVFAALDHSRVLGILHNPRYAGAFVYGRTRQRKVILAGQARFRRIPRADWKVFLPNTHPGYISWEEFEANQTALLANANPNPKITGRELVENSMKQNDLLCVLNGSGRPHVTPHTQEVALMRLSVTSLRRMIKGKLQVEFVRHELTSYSGLELVRRYLRQLDVPSRLRAACAATGGDYGGGRLALLILALFYVGARRLEHLRYLASDPLIARFCGLARIPTARTVGNWLRQFTQTTPAPLVQLNHDLVIDAVKRLALPRLTIDVDGTVVRTGATVGWAFRGFNPHHRKDPSYYPLLAHLAQTGHILRVKNRPGNVHDSKQAVAFLREVIDGLRAPLGRRLPLEFRMDAAFFQRDVFRLLTARGCAYAVKVGYWSWLPLKQLAAARQPWLPVAPNVTGFLHDLDIPQWNLRLRVMIYRTHVDHESPKNFQLDLFTPDDGHFEYAAVATNMALDRPALYAFICGRGAQEKTLAELKGEFALDVVPTRHYGANSAWQQLSVLAYNLIRSFQLDTLAEPKPRSRKRTYAYLIRSMRTLRFLLISRAGRLARIGGRHVLRLSQNPATEALYAFLNHRLAA